MGDLLGSAIGAIGGIFGGNKSDKQVTQNALTGYNFLTKGQGAQANTTFLNNGTYATNAAAQLLGLWGGSPDANTSAGFNNYLNSAGYNFQLDSGSRAITGNAASRGLLNSGATAKALTKYGQDLGSSYFNNYLTQLGSLSDRGQTALGQTAQAGTSGGGNAAAALTSGNATQGASGLGNAFGNIASMATMFI